MVDLQAKQDCMCHLKCLMFFYLSIIKKYSDIMCMLMNTSKIFEVFSELFRAYRTQRLSVDWINRQWTFSGRLGLDAAEIISVL